MTDKPSKPTVTTSQTKHTTHGDYRVSTKVTYDPQTRKPVGVDRKVTQK